MWIRVFPTWIRGVAWKDAYVDKGVAYVDKELA